MDLITSGRRWEGEGGTLSEGIERGGEGRGWRKRERLSERKKEKRKEGQGGRGGR